MQTVIYNGNIYVENGRFVEAVLITDGLIQMIGSNDEILSLASNDAQRIDANGRAVIPGFNDTHIHIYSVGQSLQAVQLYGSASISEVIERSREFIRKNNTPVGTFITGRGWNQDYFTDENRLLTRHDLDQISTEHPILFNRACGHMAVCNTKALEVAGITSKTTQISGAEFYLGQDGEPNGIFTESSIDLISSHVPLPTIDDMAQSLRTAMQYAASHGVTSVQTNDIHEGDYNEIYQAYNRVYQDNTGIVRAYHQCCFTNTKTYSKFLSDGFKTGVGDSFNKIGPLKLFTDGSLGARTALMRDSYVDDTSTNGICCMTQELLNNMIKLADDNGCQVAVHAIGDKSIEMVLDGYDTVIENHNNTKRHGVVHCQITDRVMLNRFKENDILAYVQPIFLHYDMHIVESRIGGKLASTSYAFGDLYRMGVHTSYGTDSPVEDLNTMDNIYCAVTRRDLKSSKAYYPQQSVSVSDAIHLYTAAGAYNSFEENVKGKLLPGYYADVVILSEDIFNSDVENIRNIKVDTTMVDGKIVYQR